MTTTATDPAYIKALRLRAGLTQKQAAALVQLGKAERWNEYESGARTPHPSRVELFLLLTDQHPTLRVTPRAPITKRKGKS